MSVFGFNFPLTSYFSSSSTNHTSLVASPSILTGNYRPSHFIFHLLRAGNEWCWPDEEFCPNPPAWKIISTWSFFLASFCLYLSPSLCVSCYWGCNCSSLLCVIAAVLSLCLTPRTVELNYSCISIESWSVRQRHAVIEYQRERKREDAVLWMSTPSNPVRDDVHILILFDCIFSAARVPFSEKLKI